MLTLILIQRLLDCGMQWGHWKWECDYRLSCFLLGLRNYIHIINLFYTLFILKQALYVTYNMCISHQKILVANDIGYKFDMTFEKIDVKYLWYLNDNWICGLLSNQKGIFLNNYQMFVNTYGEGYSCLLPSYVFASNVKETKSCVFEAMLLGIPNSALIDSNMGDFGIFYGIPANDDNFVSIYMFTKLFIRTFFKGIYDNLKNLKTKYKNVTLNNFEYAELYNNKDYTLVSNYFKHIFLKKKRWWRRFYFFKRPDFTRNKIGLKITKYRNYMSKLFFLLVGEKLNDSAKWLPFFYKKYRMNLKKNKKMQKIKEKRKNNYLEEDKYKYEFFEKE